METTLCQENHTPLNSPVSGEGQLLQPNQPPQEEMAGLEEGQRKCANPSCYKPFTPKRNRQRFCGCFCAKSITGKTNAVPASERLWPRLLIKDNGCWEWQGGKDKDGYGQLTGHGERRAHRVAWILAFGAIPTGKQILHRCDNPPCCNPLHLWCGTNTENMRDKISKGRGGMPSGENAPRVTLTANDVRTIRRMHSSSRVSQRVLAQMFGVGYKAISKIVLRQRWKGI